MAMLGRLERGLRGVVHDDVEELDMSGLSLVSSLTHFSPISQSTVCGRSR